MKYIIDIPNVDVSRWVAETPLGKKLYIPISVEDGHEYSIATEIYAEEYTEPDRKAVDLQHARDIENVARMNYNKGAKDAWEFARAINYLGYDDFVSCFGGKTEEAVYELSYSEVKAKYEEWKKQKEEIHVGDEVTDNDLGDIGVVTYVNDSCCCVLWSDGVVSEDVRKSELSSTGRHFNITHELLKKMKEHREKDGN